MKQRPRVQGDFTFHEGMIRFMGMDEATRQRISAAAKAEFGPTCEVQFQEDGGRDRLMILLEGDVISKRQLFQFADFGKQTDEALRRVIRNMCPLPLGA